MGEVIPLESRRRNRGSRTDVAPLRVAPDPEAADPEAADRGTPDRAGRDRVIPGPVAGSRRTDAAPSAEPLWREVVGRRLRDLRQARGERLADTAARAGISPQYLSELERGRKDPSSEILAAAAGALGVVAGGGRGARPRRARPQRPRRPPPGPVLLAA